MDLKRCEESAQKIWKKKDPVWNLEKDAVCIGDVRIPLMPWRFDRRLTEMRGLVGKGKAVYNLCAYKSVRVDWAGTDFNDILLRELDVCQWMIGQDIVSVYAVSRGDKAMLALAETAFGTVCAFDLAATLSPESKPVTRHEIIGVEGIITDRSINEQVPVDAVYVFKDDKKYPDAYTDMDFSMLGLTSEEIQIVDFILDLLANPAQYKELQDRYDRLTALIEVFHTSVQTGKKVFVGGKAV